MPNTTRPNENSRMCCRIFSLNSSAIFEKNWSSLILKAKTAEVLFEKTINGMAVPFICR